MIKKLLEFLKETNIITVFYIEDVGNGISIEFGIDILRRCDYNFDLASATSDFIEEVIEDKIGKVLDIKIREVWSCCEDEESDCLPDYKTIEYLVEYNEKSKQLIN